MGHSVAVDSFERRPRGGKQDGKADVKNHGTSRFAPPMQSDAAARVARMIHATQPRSRERSEQWHGPLVLNQSLSEVIIDRQLALERLPRLAHSLKCLVHHFEPARESIDAVSTPGRRHGRRRR